MSYTVNEIYTQAPSHVLGCLWMLTPSEQWWWCVYERECVFVCVCVRVCVWVRVRAYLPMHFQHAVQKHRRRISLKLAS